MPVSDAVIPQPIVQTGNCYMGDYDYWQADGTSVQGSCTDSQARVRVVHRTCSMTILLS